MWGDFQHIGSFVQRLFDHLVLLVVELHDGLLQVPHATVDQLRTPTRRAAREVVGFHEGCTET